MPSDKTGLKTLGEHLRLMRFGIIGLAAGSIHYLSAVLLVELAGVRPLPANVVAFLIAFWCSFFGHLHWTFGDRMSMDTFAALRKFFGTAVLGFMLNQFLFYLLLTCFGMPYFIALAIVIFAVAGITYVLSKFWAFRVSGISERSGR